MRLLVACPNIVINGGVLRFDRVAAVIAGWGHELAFVCVAEEVAANRHTRVPVLSLEQAAAQQWDAVMVPGAGFPPAGMARLSQLKAANFGLRVQHILNDQTYRAGFKAVNDVFAPHLVVFNNEHWPPGSFTELSAERFHVLLGAVDTQGFRPPVYRSHPLEPGRWTIGWIAHKQPEPLIAALALLPQGVSLRLFGFDHLNLRARHAGLVAAGRLQLTGPLLDGDLCRYYRGLDCVASIEQVAGWANIAAEALASGLPLICTRHGTTAFARHEETALLIDEPTPLAIAAAVERLRHNKALCQRLAEAGREAICAYSWEAYARGLLALLQQDRQRHYVHAPELGRFGKWPLEERLNGLDPVLQQAEGASILDLGAAEGLVGREFLKRGAPLLHGFDIDAERVSAANALCAAWPQARFRTADLADLRAFLEANRDLLLETYDITLYMGLHQHLPKVARLLLLEEAARRARRYLVVRAPAPLLAADGVGEILAAAGFRPLNPSPEAADDKRLGTARIYCRTARGDG